MHNKFFILLFLAAACVPPQSGTASRSAGTTSTPLPTATPYNPPTSFNPGATLVTYSVNILPIVNRSCISCHSNRNPILTQPANAVTNCTNIAAAVASGKMPQGQTLTTAERTLFAQWQAGGCRP